MPPPCCTTRVVAIPTAASASVTTKPLPVLLSKFCGRKAGQWSARKAQIVAQEYEKAGGGYKGGKGEKQKSLEKWGKEKWMTKDEYEKRKKAKAAAKKYKDSK